MSVINIHEAKTHFAKILQRALAGEEIIVAKHGKPLVRLVPVSALNAEPRLFGRHPQLLGVAALAAAMAEVGEDEIGDWTAS